MKTSPECCKEFYVFITKPFLRGIDINDEIKINTEINSVLYSMESLWKTHIGNEKYKEHAILEIENLIKERCAILESEKIQIISEYLVKQITLKYEIKLLIKSKQIDQQIKGVVSKMCSVIWIKPFKRIFKKKKKLKKNAVEDDYIYYI